MRPHSEMKQDRTELKHPEPGMAQLHSNKPYVRLLAGPVVRRHVPDHGRCEVSREWQRPTP